MIHCINRLQKEKLLILSIDTEKAKCIKPATEREILHDSAHMRLCKIVKFIESEWNDGCQGSGVGKMGDY